MKKKLMVIASCALLLFAAGCKKDGQNAPDSFIGDVASPTWTVPEAYDYTSSMTAVVKVDLKAQYPGKAADWQLNDNDILAAFSGDNCVGASSPNEGLFFLTIVDAEKNITLRYYSVQYKNLFEARDVFPFHNDDHLGTIAEPLVPTFVVVKQ